jgi:hypothetical protein
MCAYPNTPPLQMVTPHYRGAWIVWSALHVLVQQCGATLVAAELRVEGSVQGMVLCVRDASTGALTAARLEDTCTTLRTYMSRMLMSW